MKSGFQTNLATELKEGCDNIWIVTKPLVYWSELLSCQIEVPVSFYTDFASVPRVPVFYELWGNRAHREAVLHDYLYRIDSVPVVTKSQADKVFPEAMKSTGKSWYIRWPMYSGVVLAGSGAYHKRKVGDVL